MEVNVKSEFDDYKRWSWVPFTPSREQSFEERDKRDLNDYIQKIIKFIKDNNNILILDDYQKINEKFENVINVKDIPSMKKLTDLKEYCKPFLYKIITKFSQLKEKLIANDPENKSEIEYLDDSIFYLYKIV